MAMVNLKYMLQKTIIIIPDLYSAKQFTQRFLNVEGETVQLQYSSKQKE